MEQIMETIKGASAAETNARDWRKSLGMFNDRPVMQQIDEAGRRIRQEDCQ